MSWTTEPDLETCMERATCNEGYGLVQILDYTYSLHIEGYCYDGSAPCDVAGDAATTLNEPNCDWLNSSFPLTFNYYWVVQGSGCDGNWCTLMGHEQKFQCEYCKEQNILFPNIQDGFSYSAEWSEFESAPVDCGILKGQVESALFTCVKWYRCKYKPGYVYDEDTGEWLYNCEYCEIKVILDNSIICYGDNKIATIQSINNSCMDTENTIYVSYAGSELTYGVDFTGPKSFSMVPGSTYLFEIVTYKLSQSYTKKIVFTLTDSYGKCVYTNGNSFEFDVEPCEYYNPPINTINTCCEFFDKNYEIWTKTEDDKFYCEDFFYDTPMLY